MVSGYSRNLGLPTILEEAGVAESPVFDNYVTVVYWAMETITTIGYGDLTGQSTPERFYSLFCMSLGTMIYAYILSSLISIVKRRQKMMVYIIIIIIIIIYK